MSNFVSMLSFFLLKIHEIENVKNTIPQKYNSFQPNKKIYLPSKLSENKIVISSNIPLQSFFRDHYIFSLENIYMHQRDCGIDLWPKLFDEPRTRMSSSSLPITSYFENSKKDLSLFLINYKSD